MQLFHSENIQDNLILMDEQDSRHCSKVLRMQHGDKVMVTDGKGYLYETEIMDNNPKKTLLTVINKKYHELQNFRIHVAVAPTKNISRMEWFLEKATEIGIDTITPIICEHSERKIIKTERLRKIIISAAKQSLKFHFPVLNESIELKKFIKQEFPNTNRFIGWCDETKKASLKNAYEKGNDSLILIGPEGDFSVNEIKMAESQGFQPIMMGRSRLRTETAALVACHTINLLNE